MPILAGEKATAARINDEIGAALSDIQNTSGTTTSTSYTATLTGGTACGFSFVAPNSGKVLIMNITEAVNSGGGTSACTIRVRTGGTVGSGSDVLAAADDEAAVVGGTNSLTVSRPRLLAGLTAGSTYNVQQLFRVTSGTGTFSRKGLVLKPTQ